MLSRPRHDAGMIGSRVSCLTTASTNTGRCTAAGSSSSRATSRCESNCSSCSRRGNGVSGAGAAPGCPGSYAWTSDMLYISCRGVKGARPPGGWRSRPALLLLRIRLLGLAVGAERVRRSTRRAARCLRHRSAPQTARDALRTAVDIGDGEVDFADPLDLPLLDPA